MERPAKLRRDQPARHSSADLSLPPPRPQRARLRVLPLIVEDAEGAIPTNGTPPEKSPARRRKVEISRLDDDPLWYKDALVYELHVRAFSDSNGDGSGDFRG